MLPSFFFHLNFFVDIFLFSFASLFSFSNGYYALCGGPSHGRRLRVYQITQVLLCILWFILSIVSAGNLDGWTKMGMLNECGLKFSMFLAVVQNLVYMIDIGLAVFCVIKVTRVSQYINSIIRVMLV